MQVCTVLENRIDTCGDITRFHLIITDGFTADGKAQHGAESFDGGFSGVEVAYGTRGIHDKDQEKWDLRRR